ncbi:PKD domain-containing protein [Flavobacteriales bacterium]|nr:PKD domain-containing protein [Flavobacteriales bacterium]
MKKTILTSLYVILLTNFCFSQCPQFYDYNGNLSSLPEWIVCDGSDFSLNLQSDVNIGNYSIDWGDGSAQSSGNSWLANNAIIHTYNQSVATYTLTINLTDIPCTVTGEITMEEPTNASIQIPFGGITSTCAPGDIDFINSSTDVSENTTFTWNFSDGTPNETFDFNNVGQLVSHLYESGTVSCATQVTLTAENKCNTLQGGASLATFTPIRIWEIDNVSISASSTLLCYPDVSVSFQNTSDRNCHAQGNVNQRYEYWNLGDYWGLGYDSIIDWRPWPPALNIDVDFPGVGNYEIMLIDSSFCGLDSATVYVNIVNSPIAGLSADDDSICVGESILFHNLSTGFTSNYIWDFGDGSSWTQIWGGDILRTFFTPGTFEVLLIPQISGACRDTARVNIFVSDVPNANFSFDNNDGCDSLNVQISNISSTDITQWDWDFGNGNTDNSSIPPLQHYDTSGLYTVSLNVSNTSGCTNSFSDQINVYESPISNFEPINVCVNQLSQFNDLSLSQANDAIINWSWEFSSIDSSNLQNPTYAFTNAGIHEVILEVSTAHCKDSDTIDVFVESLPTANYSTDTSIGCSPLNITFINSSSNNSINYDWDFGDNSSSNVENTMHEFINTSSNDTTYNSLLIVSTLAGCKDSISKPITVLSNPTASFTNNAVLDCAPLNVDFTNTSSNASNYVWDLGDGSDTETNTHINHSFDNLNLLIETFDVELIAFNTNGCKDTTTNKIIVYPQPQFDFSTIPATGCSPLEVNFPSSNGAVAYNWDFGDGNSSFISTPTHTYNNNTNTNLTFNVKLLATSPFGCMDSSFQQIEVFPNPTANFITSEDTACSPLNTTITNISTNANDYQWYMGDGTTSNSSNNEMHTYSNSSNSQLSFFQNLKVENQYGCKDSIQQEVIVLPVPNAQFSVSENNGCHPFEISINNTSTDFENYIFDMGNGNTISSTLQTLNYSYQNTTQDVQNYTISLLASSLNQLCTDTFTTAVSVYPKVFSKYVSDSAGCSPLNAQFYNLSTNADIYEWDFGNRQNSNTALTASQQYINNSSQTISFNTSLISSSNYGCSDTSYQVIYVYPTPLVDFSVSPISQTLPNSTVEITNNSSVGNWNYQWGFGDNNQSQLENPSPHNYTSSGEYGIQLIMSNIHSCSDSAIHWIEILPAMPGADFDVEASGCIPLKVNFESLSLNASTYSWDFGDGTFSSKENPIKIYYEDGIYSVSLTVFNGMNSDSKVQVNVIEVFKTPISQFTLSTD